MKTIEKNLGARSEMFRFKILNTLQASDFCWIGHSSEPAAEGLCHARRIKPHMVIYDRYPTNYQTQLHPDQIR
jgi:hypothetical protein